jgi:hypothetical protein
MHLHRYLAEYDFRCNHCVKLGFNDLMRAEILAANIKGKRLTYRRPNRKVIPFPGSPIHYVAQETLELKQDARRVAG